MEQIGKVILDDTYYPGEDFYCDGAVEDELLALVQKYSKEELQGVIEERADWPTFYHLSSQRENIVEWLPMDKTTKVLEVGSGCGAITGMLSRKAGSVTSIDLSKKRSTINAYRNKECDNVTIHMGNFKDIEPHLPCDYDYVVLIGVFEYANGYMGTDTPYHDFMNILRKHLLPNGRLVIAIENQFGLKYWAGCKEDHLGTYFSGLEDYEGNHGVRTFTRSGLESILQENKIEEYEFYYPYPDYKFMSTLYSDKRLPRVGELTQNRCNYDRERMLLFDEAKVYQTILKEKQYPLFSNSYVLVTGPKITLDYCKYSNEREEKYSIVTSIKTLSDGSKVVEKSPCTCASADHVNQMAESYELLCKRYEGGKLQINRLLQTSPVMEFEYVEGISLETLLDECIKRGDAEGFLALFQEYRDVIGYNAGVDISSVDCIFGNILVSEDQWTLIDYEWTVKENVPVDYLAYRAFYCYLLSHPEQSVVNQVQILEMLQMSPEKALAIQEEEAEFQVHVTGNQLSKAQIGEKINQPVLTMDHLRQAGNAMETAIQIYENYGHGFSEEEAYFMGNSKVGMNHITISVPQEVTQIRLDPCMQSALMRIFGMKWNGQPLKTKGRITSNGMKLEKDQFLFQTKDPNVTIDLRKVNQGKMNELEISYELSLIQEQ